MDKLGGRAQLGINLDENWTITPSVIGQLEKQNGFFGFDPSVGDLKVMHFNPEFAKDHWWQAALTISGKIANLDLTYSGGYMDARRNSSADYSDYTFWYDTLGGYYLTDNSAIRRLDAVHPGQRPVHEAEQRSTPFLAAGLAPALRGRVFPGKADALHPAELPGHRAGSDFWVTGWPHTLWLTDQLRVDRDIAGFGEASFDIFPDLTLNAACACSRPTTRWPDSSGSARTIPVTPARPPASGRGCSAMRPCTNINKRAKETRDAQGKPDLAHRRRSHDLCHLLDRLQASGVNRSGSLPPYHSDNLTNYEIGWKTTWLDNTLRFNGAAYWEDWENFQFAFLGINSLTQINNAGGGAHPGRRVGDHPGSRRAFHAHGGGPTTTTRGLTKVYCGDLDPVTGALDTTCPNATYPYPPAAPKAARCRPRRV